MRWEELLEQNQKTITETTSLQKRLHELSISIAKKQQDQQAGTDGPDAATRGRIANAEGNQRRNNSNE